MHLPIYLFILFIIIINNQCINEGAICSICLAYLEEKHNSATEELRSLLFTIYLIFPNQRILLHIKSTCIIIFLLLFPFDVYCQVSNVY